MGVLDRLILRVDQWERVSTHMIGDERARGSSDHDTRLCGLAPLYILGLAAPGSGAGSMIPLIVMLVGTAWGFFIHANLRWRFGPLEWLISTPAFHHWHHTNDDPAHFNKNYSAMLPWVDYVFGTLYLPKTTPPCYGIDAPLPEGIVCQMAHPFRKSDEADGVPERP